MSAALLISATSSLPPSIANECPSPQNSLSAYACTTFHPEPSSTYLQAVLEMLMSSRPLTVVVVLSLRVRLWAHFIIQGRGPFTPFRNITHNHENILYIDQDGWQSRHRNLLWYMALTLGVFGALGVRIRGEAHGGTACCSSFSAVPAGCKTGSSACPCLDDLHEACMTSLFSVLSQGRHSCRAASHSHAERHLLDSKGQVPSCG